MGPSLFSDTSPACPSPAAGSFQLSPTWTEPLPAPSVAPASPPRRPLHGCWSPARHRPLPMPWFKSVSPPAIFTRHLPRSRPQGSLPPQLHHPAAHSPPAERRGTPPPPSLEMAARTCRGPHAHLHPLKIRLDPFFPPAPKHAAIILRLERLKRVSGVTWGVFPSAAHPHRPAAPPALSLDAITTNSRIFTAVVSLETSANVLIHREGAHGGYGGPAGATHAGPTCGQSPPARRGFPMGRGGDDRKAPRPDPTASSPGARLPPATSQQHRGCRFTLPFLHTITGNQKRSPSRT